MARAASRASRMTASANTATAMDLSTPVTDSATGPEGSAVADDHDQRRAAEMTPTITGERKAGRGEATKEDSKSPVHTSSRGALGGTAGGTA